MIPRNLNECFDELNNNITTEELVTFMQAGGNLANYHHGVGTDIRNAWGLWKDSVLAKYFNKMGIYHADDMSTIILTSYFRHVRNMDIKLKEQVEMFISFWEKQGFKNGDCRKNER